MKKNTIAAKDKITIKINKTQQAYIRKHKTVNSKLMNIKPKSPVIEISTLNIITMIGTMIGCLIL